jgi:hypothetical protein
MSGAIHRYALVHAIAGAKPEGKPIMSIGSLQNINNYLSFSFAILLTNIDAPSTLPGVEMNSHEAPVPLGNALALCPTRPPKTLRVARVSSRTWVRTRTRRNTR